MYRYISTDMYFEVYMQTGKLKVENVELLTLCKELGFSNKTKMMDYALDLLRQRVKKQKRAQLREALFTSYSESKSENYFESIDGDDFE